MEKNDYQLLQDRFKNVDFKTCARLAHEYIEKMGEILYRFRKKYGEYLLNGLKFRLQEIEDIPVGAWENVPCFVKYIYRTKTILINVTYFELNAYEEYKDKLSEDTFDKAFIHEMARYGFFADNELKKTIQNFYNNNKEDLDALYSSDYVRSLYDEEEMLSEIFAGLFTDNYKKFIGE